MILKIDVFIDNEIEKYFKKGEMFSQKEIKEKVIKVDGIIYFVDFFCFITASNLKVL